ncbi:MAG: class I SAM-dependent methyltransferase [Acidimicrobiales bacterium]|nr:class I SAM-dependent methyltransferase [Acidimicrobiales bacterium]
MSSSYAFGHSPTAAARLVALADAFEEPSHSFLVAALQVHDRPIGLAVDLGCGPGRTTRTLVQVARPVAAAGLDVSEAFLDQARTLELPDTTWHRHDVTEVPFPLGPADLLYGRYLLAHLRTPASVLEAWLTQLHPGGLLLLEEDEWIATSNPILASYLDLVVALVAHRGGELYLGTALKGPVGLGGHRPVFDRLYQHPVPVPVAARLFSMNFATWRHDPFVTERRSPGFLDRLAAGLAALAGSDDSASVTFALRQVAYRRSESVAV